VRDAATERFGLAPTEDQLLAALPTLREVVEALAPLERRAGSAGEQQAAHWSAAQAERRGGGPRHRRHRR
jgi:hypothetical protein